MDIDDYINNLIKDNEHFKNVIESLKKEIKTQRIEIALLREERKLLFNNDRIPYSEKDFFTLNNQEKN